MKPDVLLGGNMVDFSCINILVGSVTGSESTGCQSDETLEHEKCHRYISNYTSTSDNTTMNSIITLRRSLLDPYCAASIFV
jgi:hypothetical protein